MLEVKNLKKTYKTKGGNITKALDDVSIVFPEKGLIFLLGKSGSGKSTLLNVIGGLDRVDSGEIIIKGKNSKDFSASDFDLYRNTFIGFIFQEYNILNEFNIEQNIALALQLQGKKNDHEAVEAILKQVELENFGKRKPNTLSGGQKQRVAIARALIKNPEIIMADEPTGALDSKTGKQIFDTLKNLSKDKLIIVVSHDRDFAELYADRIIELADGKITSDTTKEKIEGQDLGNIRVVNNNTIAIKDTAKLTKKDVEVLLENLKNKKGEILLTSGEKDLHSVKQALHLSEDSASEVFKDTKKVKTKEYDPKDTKFIRSHLPFGRAFKMGSSYLKLKPVRLVFTSLLTIVSLTLFGVASTLMLFKDSYAYANALKDTPYKSEVVAKTYDVKRVQHKVKGEVDEVEYEYDTTDYGTFSKDEIKSLNSNRLGLKFAPVLTFNLPSMYSGGRDAISTIDPIDSKAKTYYYYAYKPSGFIPTDAEYVNSTNDLSIKTGNYPKAEDEVAISEYAAEYFKEAFNVANVDKVVGKTITVSISGNRGSVNKKLNVSGILTTPTIDEQFADLKSDTSSKSDRELEELYSNFKDYMKNDYASFYFVYETFGESFVDSIFSIEENVYDAYRSTKGFALFRDKSELDYNDISSDSYWYSFFTPSVVKGNISRLKFYDQSGKLMTYKEPAKFEAYIPMDYMNNSVRESINSFLWNLREFISHREFDDYKAYSSFMRNLTAEQAEAINAAIDEANELMNIDYGSSYDAVIQDEVFQSLIQIYNTGYAEYTNNTYLYYALQNFFNVTTNYTDAPHPGDWSQMKAYYEAIDDDPTAYDFSHYDEFVEYLTEYPDILFVDNIMPMLFEVRYDYERYNIPEDMQVILEAAYSRFYDSNTYPTASQIETLKEFYDIIKKTDSYRYSEVYFKMPNPVADFSPAPINEIYYKNYANKTGAIKVLGYVQTSNNSYAYFVSDELLDDYALAAYDDSYSYYTEYVTEYVAPENAYYSGAISRTSFTQEEIEFMQQELPSKANLVLTNPTAVTVGSTLSLFAILKPTFLISGIVLGVFAALMLLNYVSASINSKTREIGILRAVGARGSDLFKIFFSESGLMTAICLVLSLAASIFIVYRLNLVFMDGFIKVALLSFGLLNVAIMIAGAIAIAILGTIIPVAIAAKKQPVDSIRSL